MAFRTPNEIGKFFPFKDRVRQITSRAFVVYRIKCSRSDCDATYIGKTQRILCHRLKEHQNQESSACKQHESEHEGHKMDYENVEILDQAESNLYRVTLLVGNQSLTRAYSAAQNGTLYPAGAWVRKE